MFESTFLQTEEKVYTIAHLKQVIQEEVGERASCDKEEALLLVQCYLYQHRQLVNQTNLYQKINKCQMIRGA
jgi:hypothetical protein